MPSHHETGARTPPPSVLDDPLGYWWPVCHGEEIMRAFQAAPETEAWRVIERYPVLLMPELIDAAERMLGHSRPFDGLREMHQALRGSAAYAAYHRLLVSALIGERRGSHRANLERALAVIKDVRRAAPGDATDERTEQAIRSELAALVEASAKPSAMHALFLDEDDLPGYQRGGDRRDANPNLSDRTFASLGGLTAGAAEWFGDVGSPMYRVVDARWVFASTKAAKAYLDSPATHLLARDGMASPAVLQIGDGAYAWGGPRAVPGGRGRQCLLFRVDRVVARFDVTEGPKAAQELQALARAHLLPFTEAIVRRTRRVLAEYWLGIGRGTQAAQAFVQAPPRKAELVLAEHPILLLPEFPTAMALLDSSYRPAAERLAVLQGASRNNWKTYRELLRALVRTLLDDNAGEPRINADAALRLVIAHRQHDIDQSWAALEVEASDRAAGKSAAADA
jgi:hypothetical protein